MWQSAIKGEIMKNYKRTEVNGSLFVLDYGNEKFEVHMRAWAPLGTCVYRYENGRLKWFQRRSYSGSSSVKYFNFYK